MDDARIALVDRGLDDIEVTEKHELLEDRDHQEAVKREEIMHLSRQLGAFIRAGMPIIDAIETLGEEAEERADPQVLADIAERLRRGETARRTRIATAPEGLPDVLPRHPALGRADRQLDTVLDQLAGYLERDLEARRKIKSAMMYPMVVIGMSRRTVVVLAASCCRSSRRSSPPRRQAAAADPDAAGDHRLPHRVVVGARRWSSWSHRSALFAATCAPSAASTCETGSAAAAGDRRRHPVRPGRAVLPRPRLDGRRRRAAARGAGGGCGCVHNLRLPRALAEAARAMLGARAWPSPLTAPGCSPAALPDDPGRRGHRHPGHPARGRGDVLRQELDYKLKSSRRCSSPPIIVVMGLIVGFVAIALVSAMYGIFNQVKVK